MKKVQILMVLTILGWIACQSDKTVNNNNNNRDRIPNNVIKLDTEELKKLDIITDIIHKRNIIKQLHFKGKIDVPPQNMYSMSIPLGGYLKSTHLLPGMKIQKGEVIAVIEDPKYIELQQEYLNTQIQFEAIEKNYIRQKELWEQKAASDKILEQTRAEYETQKTKLKALEEKLKLININPAELTSDKISKNINIYAPFTGFVTAINFSVGKYIQPSEVLFELVNPEDIHLNIKIFEKDLEYIKIGQKVWAYTNQNVNKKYPCEIILINKVVNSDGTIDVHCHFDTYDNSLIPNTYMQADVIVQSDSVYAIPSDAVVFFNNKYFVFVQNKLNEFEMVEIAKKTEDERYVGIENYTMLMNKKIVTKNAYALLMKLKNSVEEE